MLDTMLTSLRASFGGKELPLDIIVVDNASTDGTIEMLAEKHPYIRLKRHTENLGGTGGFNAGMRYGLARQEYRYIWLMDNDIIVHPGAFEALKKPFVDDPRVGLVGSHVLYLEDNTRTQEIGSWIDWKTGWLGQHDRDVVAPSERLNDCDFVSACSLMARVSAMRSVGIWDPAYFITWDDVDWGVRMKRGGWRVVATSAAKVEHASYAARRPRQGIVNAFYSVRNFLYFYLRHAPARYRFRLLFHAMRRSLGDSVLAPSYGEKATGAALRAAVLGFFFNKMGKGPAFDFATAPPVLPWPKLPAKPKILLLGSVSAEFIEEQRTAILNQYPGADVSIFLNSGEKELIVGAKHLKGTKIVPFQTSLQRLKSLMSVRREGYAALVAASIVRPLVVEEFAPYVVRLDPNGHPTVVTRGGTVPLMRKVFIRLSAAALAAILAVVSLLKPMPRPKFFPIPDPFNAWGGGAAPIAPAPPKASFPQALKGSLNLLAAACLSLVVTPYYMLAKRWRSS